MVIKRNRPENPCKSITLMESPRQMHCLSDPILVRCASPGFLDIKTLRSLVPAYQPPTYYLHVSDIYSDTYSDTWA